MKSNEEIFLERKKNIESLRTLISKIDFKEFICYNSVKYFNIKYNDKIMKKDVKSDSFFARDEYIFGLMGSIEYTKKESATSNLFSFVDDLTKKIFKSYQDEILLEVPNLNKLDNFSKFKNMFFLINAFYFFNVRGDSYISKMKDLAYLLYSPFDKLLLKRLGFTIQDAFKFSDYLLDISINRYFKFFCESIITSTDEPILKFNEYLRKKYGNEMMEKMEKIREEYSPDIHKIYKEMEKLVDLNEIENYLIKTVGKNKTNEKFRKYLFENKNMLGLDTKDFNFDEENKLKFERFLNRFSFECGTINDTFTDLTQYNEFINKPIMVIDNQIYLPIPTQLPWTIVNSIYYDLIDNRDNLTIKSFNGKIHSGNFGQIRGFLIEDKVLNLLERVILKENIFINIQHNHKKNGESDIIVVEGDTLLIVECKGKRLTINSKFGNYGSIKNDLDKSIRYSFKQLNKTLDLINKNEIELKNDYKTITIKKGDFRYIFKLIITDSIFAYLSTNPIFLNNKDLPVVFNLYDLDIILSELKINIDFYNYLLNRTYLNNWGFFIASDEKDLLAYYQNNSFSFKNKIKKNKLWIVKDQCDSLDEKYTYLDDPINFK